MYHLATKLSTFKISTKCGVLGVLEAKDFILNIIQKELSIEEIILPTHIRRDQGFDPK